MDFNAYQIQAKSFAIYPPDKIGDVPVYPALGLVEEAGEVAGKLKKIIRDKNGQMQMDDYHAVTKELGDVLWYLSAMCSELGLSLEQVAKENILKLSDRQARGKLSGSGDNR